MPWSTHRKKTIIAIAIGTSFLLTGPARGQTANEARRGKITVSDRARRIHDSATLVDGHNDLPWAIRVRAGGDLSLADPSRELPGYHTDGARLRVGGVGGQFWSVFVPSWQPDPFDSVMEQIDLVEEMTRNDPIHLRQARTAEDVVTVSRSGRTASLIGAEGGHAIENDLGKLRELRARGVRYMTLTHGDTIEWADSATDDRHHGGLTAFGRSVVESMNDLGVIVDISHVSAETMRAALETTQRPIMASHSGARSIAPHPRNVPDDVLEFIANNIRNNIRELEGALIRVGAFASLTREPLGLDLAVKVLADIVTDGEPRPITLDRIVDATKIGRAHV